jgi:DNA-binding NarL/FixJ family response regulator
MPGMSGAELASEIKTHNPQVPFMLVSGCEPVLEEAPHFVDAAVPKGAPMQLMLDKLKALLALRGHAHRSNFLSRFVPVGSVVAGIALGVLLLPKAFR